MLGALGAALPLTVAAAMAGAAAGAVRSKDDRGKTVPPRADPLRTVLVSGGKMTKALALARAFHAAGHRVILCESERYWMSAHRTSRAVHAFHTMPDHGDPAYPEALKALVARYGVDTYVPVTSPAGSIHDSDIIAELDGVCEVLHADPEAIAMLDDKHAFAKEALAHGLPAPKSVRITHAQQVLDYDFAAESRPFILKSIAYDPVLRLDLTRLPLETPEATEAYVRSLPISPDNPFVMQEFIEGEEFCTHGFFRDGGLRVHIACKSSPFQVNYDHVDEPEILDWVTRFGAATGLTGQASFDFIRAADDGRFYAIECNPRTHSAITLLDSDPRLAAAYLDEGPVNAPLQPAADAQPTYWIAHEAWRMARAFPDPGRMANRAMVVVSGRDAVFRPADPLPFLALHHVHVPLLLLRSLAERRDWLRIDFNIGKLVQAGGD